jgi:acyl carrier protein
MNSPLAQGFVIQVLHKLIDEGQIHPRIDRSQLAADLPMADLGLDSIGQMIFLQELESALEMAIPFESLRGIVTLADLSNLISKLQGNRSAA